MTSPSKKHEHKWQYYESEDSFCDICGVLKKELDSPEFRMTKQEVIYFLENIKHEYLKKETYPEALNLIKRMEVFLESTL